MDGDLVSAFCDVEVLEWGFDTAHYYVKKFFSHYTLVKATVFENAET